MLLLCCATWGLSALLTLPLSASVCVVSLVLMGQLELTQQGDMIGQNNVEHLSLTDLPLTTTALVDLLNDPVSKRLVVLDNSSVSS